MAEKHRLEAELEHRLQTDPTIWRFLQEGSLDGVWYWDLESPEDEWMSPEFWRLFGIDPSSKAHKAAEWQDIIFKEDLALATENFEKHCADPEHRYDQVVRYRHADGGVVWVRCRGVAIRDDTGKAIRMLGAHNDLTKLMRARGHEILQVFEAATDAIIGFTADGRIVQANAMARHILGAPTQTPEQWPRNISFLDPLEASSLAPELDPVRRALAGETFRGERHLMSRARTAQPRTVKVSGVQVAGAVSEVRTVLILDDVTEEDLKRQRFERSNRLDALGQLTGGIAHDFNNLLGSILSSAEVARLDATSDRSRLMLDTVIDSVKRGSALARRMLSFAKQTPGQASSKQIADVFDSISLLVKSTIGENLTVRFQTDSDLYVYCDHAQLENAILNLILNARDAIERAQKGGDIRISARSIEAINKGDEPDPLDEEGSYTSAGKRIDETSDAQRSDRAKLRYVEIAVADDGPGMDDAVKQRAIEPFFTTKNTNSGTGLGLSIVYGFVKQSRGELRIYSEEGIGTTIRMMLPRGAADGSRETPQPGAKIARGAGQKVLIVEDEPSLLASLSAGLEALGYTPIQATSGIAALELVERGLSFDILLTDIVMPHGVGGFELAQRLRTANSDLPVVYMSGYTGFSNEEMGDAIAPLLAKPCSMPELAHALSSVLKSKAQST